MRGLCPQGCELVDPFEEASDYFSEILDEIESIDGLPQHLRERTRIMRNYCRLRLSTLELITLSIKEQTDRYDPDISEQNEAMEALLDQLSEE